MNSLSYSLTHAICLRCSVRLIAKASIKHQVLSSSLRLPGYNHAMTAVPFILLGQQHSFSSSSSSSGDNIKQPPVSLNDPNKTSTKSTMLVPSPSAQVISVMPTSSDSQLGNEQSKKPNESVSTAPSIKPVKQKRRRLSANPDERHTANVFVTPERAYDEYLLTTTDLAGLWNTKRRSPFDGRPDIMVYLRVDVEKRAVEIWGSLAKLEQEKQRRRQDHYERPDDMSMALLTAMRSYSAVMDTGMDEQHRLQQMIQEEQRKGQTKDNKNPQSSTHQQRNRWNRPRGDESFLENESDIAQHRQLKGSGRVVWAAIGVNAANFVLKVFAYMHTGSSAMFAESVHSLADTLNQAILAFGIYQSSRRPDQIHPYGWYNFSYVSSLISGVGIFFVGAGLSWYHGIEALLHPGELESISWALLVLAGSFLSEGASLLVGVRQIQREAASGKMAFREYVRRGYDPSVNVVLAEDCVAVVGVGVAGCCLLLSHIYSSHIPDAIGSLIIGTLLGGVASMIIYTNAVILVGQSIPEARRNMMRQELEADRVIRAVHDIKATEMGGRRVRFKAEVDIDGRELTRVYLDRIDIDLLLAELQKASKTTDDLEAFMLRHGEGIIDLIGAEIDRVERNLKKKYPEVRHVDLEVL